MTRARLWADALRTSLWFVPALMVLGAMVLAYALIALDHALPAHLWHSLPVLDHVLDVRNKAAQAVLETLAESIAAIAGVVFSITIAALTLAAGQYTSRVLRNYIRDRVNQSVLGIFLGVFVYCILVLRSLSSGGASGDHAPAFSMAVTLLLAIVAVGALIYYIHHLAQSLQASNVVAAIAHDAMPFVDRHFPPMQGGAHAELPVDEQPVLGKAWPVRSIHNGYITGISVDALVELTAAEDARVNVLRCAGQFASAGEIIAEWVAADEPDAAIYHKVAAAWSYSVWRTLENDPGYGLRQLVDVALKALSPGVNETTTAIMCVDWQGALLMRMAHRRPPVRIWAREGVVRVTNAVPGFSDFIALAFNQVRQNAPGNVNILTRQLEVLLALTDTPAIEMAHQALADQVRAIDALSEATVPWSPDRTPMRERVAELRLRLKLHD